MDILFCTLLSLAAILFPPAIPLFDGAAATRISTDEKKPAVTEKAAAKKAAPDIAESEKAAADKWEKDIAGIEARILSGESPPGGVVFVGSSSIRLWKLNVSFPDLKAVNHGFGGSQLGDTVRYFDRIVAPLKPQAFVVYAGDNDIGSGKSAEHVVGQFESLVRLSKEKLGHTPLLFVAIKPSIKRWALAPEMQLANERIQKICDQDKDLTFVDIWKPMLGKDMTPRPELFADDGLHLNEAGYRLWSSVLTPHLKVVLQSSRTTDSGRQTPASEK